MASPLCQTCRYATIVRGPSLRDDIVECQELMFRRGRITFPVTCCTSYSDRRQPSVWEIGEIAWILRSDPKRKEIGFVHGRLRSGRAGRVAGCDDARDGDREAENRVSAPYDECVPGGWPYRLPESFSKGMFKIGYSRQLLKSKCHHSAS